MSKNMRWHRWAVLPALLALNGCVQPVTHKPESEPLESAPAAKQAVVAGAGTSAAVTRPSFAKPVFSTDEIHQFLAKAMAAESIKDPLQRCLAYPDPPRSHWSPAAVQAYCRYGFQRVISFDEARALIQSGHAVELDRRLARDLQLQLTRPESRGLLDRTFYNDFVDDSAEVRATLDAWKRASPSSAFAYAASGAAYVAMASTARGEAIIRDTPQSNIDTMDQLLAKADVDLQRAIALNPKLTPAYAAMINAGRMSLGDAYTFTAAKRALAIAPDNYSIYATLSAAEEPKWGGSLQAMQQISDQAQTHAKENPLLILLQSTGPAYAFNVCNCNSSVRSEWARWETFPAVFDTVSSRDLLFSAGYAASKAWHPDLAAIYLSEELRFVPAESDARMQRNYALTNLKESGWALEEANRWIKQSPQSAMGFNMRGYAYKSIADYPRAIPDLEKASALEPGNKFPLVQLANIYVYKIHEWQKGWDVADRLVHSHPQDPEGWIFRASIQKDQPRDGLRDTASYFLDHFGNDPQQAVFAARMRAVLATAPARTTATEKSGQNP